MASIWRKGLKVSKSEFIEIIPSTPHVFQYLVKSDAYSAEFDAESIEAARERLHRYAAATPDVQTDLYEWREVDWDWVATVVESAPLG